MVSYCENLEKITKRIETS